MFFYQHFTQNPSFLEVLDIQVYIIDYIVMRFCFTFKEKINKTPFKVKRLE